MDAARKRFTAGSSAALAAMACWGIVPLFMKYLTAFMDAWTMNMYRYAVAALIYLPFIIHFGRCGRLTRRLFIASLFPTIINVLGQILWAMSPYYLKPGLIGIFIKTSIIWSTAGSLVFFADERPLARRFGFWIGILLSAACVVAMSAAALDHGRGGPGEMTVTGLAVILVCAVFWGLYPVSVKLAFPDTDPRLSFGLICVNTAVILAAAGMIMGRPAVIIGLDVKAVAILVSSAVIGIALSHLTYCYALNTIGVIMATNINMITPFYTLILSGLIFGEIITPAKLIFGTGIIAGAVILTIARRKLPAVPPAA